MQTFGRYRIEQALARSVDGETLGAFDTRLGLPVVLRVLPGGIAAEVEERFLRICAAVAGAGHAHVAPVHDLGRIAGHAFVALRLPDGEALGSLLARGPLPPSVALDVMAQLADALDASHAVGLVHGALDPAVVAVRADGFTSVFGFGFGTADADPGADRRALARLLEGALTGLPPVAAVPPSLAAVTRAEFGSGAALVAAARAARPGVRRGGGRRGVLIAAAVAVLVLVAAVAVGVARRPATAAAGSGPVAVALQGGTPGKMLLSADGKSLYVAVFRSDGTARVAGLTVVDLPSRTVTRTIPLAGLVEALVNRADGSVLAMESGIAQIVDPAAGTTKDLPLTSAPRFITRDGGVVYTVDATGLLGYSVVGFDVANRAVTSRSSSPILSVAGCDPLAAPDGRTLVCLSRSTVVGFLNVVTGGASSLPLGIEPRSVDLAPDGRHLVFVSRAGAVEVVDGATFRPTVNVQVDREVSAVAVGRRAYLACGTARVIQAVDLEGGTPVTVASSIPYATGIAVSADERTAYLVDGRELTIVDLAAS